MHPRRNTRWRGHLKTALASTIARAHDHGFAAALARGRERPLVLGYHRVVEDFTSVAATGMPSMLTSTQMFERHLDCIGRHFRFVTLDEIGAHLLSGRPFEEAVAAVTFDDGYADNYEQAYPVLKRKGIPAAVFVVTDLVGRPLWQVHDKLYHLVAKAFETWDDPRRELCGLMRALGVPTESITRTREAARTPMLTVSAILPGLPIADVRRVMDGLEASVGNRCYDIPRTLDWAQIEEMHRNGITIGSHTKSHVSLPAESAVTIADELEGSRQALESRLGEPIAHFAYPGGQFTEPIVDAVARAGYRFAYTACQHEQPQHRALTIERLLLWEGSSVDADGEFSPAILNCQTQDLWPRKCDRAHGVRPPYTARLKALSRAVYGGLTPDSSSRPALLLVTGRTVGVAASFAIGIVLARLFDPAVFGTYKQFFLVYATLYGVLQLGMAESLYYFVPRQSQHTGRYVCNAMVMLTAAGLACTAALYVGRTAIAGWLSPEVAEYVLPLGLFLTFTLTSTVLEIVMVSRQKHMAAAVTYAISDIVRTLLFIVPALVFASLRAVFFGATVFAGLRLLATVIALWREFGRDLRVDFSLWRQQLAYALPFALAVGIEVILINYHQYVVAARFDAATFAIYAIGCLQIPLFDLIITSTVNVLMVRMADADRGRAALALWHDTVGRLAFLLFPLAVFLVISARYLIVGLFTDTYAASVPIFTISVLTVLPAVMAVDAVLRVYAQTRFLLVMNVVRFVCVAGLIGVFLGRFGLTGAVLVTLLAMTIVKALGVVRIARLMHVGPREALPWGRLARIAALSGVSALPVLWLHNSVTWHPLVTFIAGACVYGGAYALLSYGGSQVLGCLGARVRVPWVSGARVLRSFTGAPVNRPVNLEPCTPRTGTQAPEHLRT